MESATAAAAANQSVRLGLVSPAVLWVGRGSSHVREFSWYKEFMHLWNALDKRAKEMDEEAAARVAKIKEAPNKYYCANPACAIESNVSEADRSRLKPQYIEQH